MLGARHNGRPALHLSQLSIRLDAWLHCLSMTRSILYAQMYKHTIYSSVSTFGRAAWFTLSHNQFEIQRISFSPPRKLGRKSWHHLHSEIINICDRFKWHNWFSPAAEKFYVSSSQNTSPNKIDTFHLSHFVGQFVTMRDYWLKFLTMLCVFAMHFGGPVRVGPVQRQWRRLISRRAAAEWPCEAVTALQMRRSPCRALSRSPLPAALFGRLRICHSQRCLLTCHLRLWQSVCVSCLCSNARSHCQNTRGQQTVHSKILRVVFSVSQ
jgi:hypothetical protein